MASLKEQLESSLYITPADLQTIADMPEDPPAEETLHLTSPPAPQAVSAPKRKQRSDAGIPKKPPARAATTGELFDIESAEGRTFMIGTVRYWMSINASPQVEAVISYLFRELDRRAQKSA